MEHVGRERAAECGQGTVKREEEKARIRTRDRLGWKEKNCKESQSRRESASEAVPYGGDERRTSIRAALPAKSRQGRRHQSTQEIRK